MSGIVLNLAQQSRSEHTTIRGDRGQDTFIDRQQDARIVMGEHPLQSLHAHIPLGSFGEDRFEIGLSNARGVTWEGDLGAGTKIYVRGIEIATVSQFYFFDSIAFTFSSEATADLAAELIGALTFKDLSATGGFDQPHRIGISLNDAAGNIAAVGINMAESVVGTAGSDTFDVTPVAVGDGDELDGGDGDDILYLSNGGNGSFRLDRMAKFAGIETIQGSNARDTVYLHASQWAGLKRIDGLGGDNALVLSGSDHDLSDTAIVNFRAILIQTDGAKVRVGTVDIAKLVSLAQGGNVHSAEIVIETGVLTDAERSALHGRGITRITTLEDGKTTAREVPELASFGDKVRALAGETVFLDKGQDALLDGESGYLTSLTIAIENALAGEALGIVASAGLALTDALALNSQLVMTVTRPDGTVEEVTFGTVVSSTASGGNIHSVEFAFNDNARVEWIQQIIRSLTYKNSAAWEGDRQITLTMKGVSGLETSVDVAVVENKTPSHLALSNARTFENAATGTVVGTLSAKDDDDALIFTLTDDAGGRFEIRGGKVVVKDGAKLDFETAASHTITVSVSDGRTAFARDFIVRVEDVLESLAGTRGKDVLKGGIGMDRINGASGNDKLTGGAGADQFVFSSALGKGTTKANQNKSVNFDTITDFMRGEDKILLDNAIFKKLGKGSLSAPGALKKAFFKKNKATDKDDYLIYKSGVLSYDADGSGTKFKPVEFIKLTNKASLSAADCLII